MGTEAPTSVVIPVHCAPKKAPCPKCGRRGCRKRILTRTVRTVAYKAIAHLKITYGEYTARCGCCTSFRNTPQGVVPKAKYGEQPDAIDFAAAGHRRLDARHRAGIAVPV